jgi:signal transduction histidine kinase
MIFEPFMRAGPEGRSGIGLGLATVKRLTEAHRGSVGVRSTLDGGSVFWVILPKAESDRACPPQRTRSDT